MYTVTPFVICAFNKTKQKILLLFPPITKKGRFLFSFKQTKYTAFVFFFFCVHDQRFKTMPPLRALWSVAAVVCCSCWMKVVTTRNNTMDDKDRAILHHSRWTMCARATDWIQFLAGLQFLCYPNFKVFKTERGGGRTSNDLTSGFE